MFLKTLADSEIVFKHIIQMNHIEEVLMNLPNSDRVAILPSFISSMINNHLTVRSIQNYQTALPYAIISLREARNPVVNALSSALYAKSTR